MTEAIIWFLLGYVSGGVVGMLVFALITANDEKKKTAGETAPEVRGDPCEECLRWPECNGVDENCPLRKKAEE